MENIKKLKLEIKYVNVDLLKIDEDNPKIHTEEQINNLRKIIRQYGFVVPLAISDDYKIRKGNGSFQAGVLEGYTELPTVAWSHLTEKQQEELSILDNWITLETNFDIEKLNLKIENLNLDLSGFGFDIGKITESFKLENPFERPTVEVKEDDLGPELLQNLVSLNRGDVFEIGRHRLIYGDSTDRNDIAKLMDGKFANMIFTDPPYNLSAKDIKSVADTDNKGFVMGRGEFSDDEFTEFLTKITKNLYEFSLAGSIHFICMDWRHIEHLMTACKVYDKFKSLCVWVKHSASFSAFYRNQHELIFIFQNGSDKYTRNFSIKDYRTNVWQYQGQSYCKFEEQQGCERVHPTMKPLQLVADAIIDCSNENEIILDLFGGSGSTMVAAHQTNRIAYLSELDPKYVNVIIRRMLKTDETLRVICNSEDVTEKFLQ